MKIDFTAVLKDAEGEIIKEGEKAAEVVTLLKRAVLADFTENGQPIPADEKLPRFELFLKLRQAVEHDTDFALDEVQLLVKAVKVFPTLVMGQLTHLLTKK